MSRRHLLIKTLLAVGAIAVLSVLFMYSLREVESTPYRINQVHLTGWTLRLDPTPSGAEGPLLSLTPPRELTMGLFQQVFERTMESMNAPAIYGVTLILKSEFVQSLVGVIEPNELLVLAKDTGLVEAALNPRCLAVRRGSGRINETPRQTFFVLFDVPEFHKFRERVGSLLGERQSNRTTFDPASLAPILYLAATDEGFRRWPSPNDAPDQECVSPVELVTPP